ncbi:MAG: hypothetical protein IJJ48_04615, partial [Firmicutes bacterium]|nr:hypothetical protein [Bacillota bacterium]
VEITDYPVVVTGITIDPPAAGIRRGDSEYFAIRVEGTDYDEYDTELLGQNALNTYIAYDRVYIDAEETAATVTLRVTSRRDPSVKKDAVITVLPPDPIPDLIEIEYDPAGLDLLTSNMTGKEVSSILKNAMYDATSTEGVYIDISSTCLAKHTGSGMVSYTDFVKLDNDTDPLDPNEEYYFIINLEETGGFVFDPGKLPEVMVNGNYGDAVSWYSDDLIDPLGSIDILMKANVVDEGDISAVIQPVKFPSLKEGYTVSNANNASRVVYVDNTGGLPLQITEGCVWLSSEEAFSLLWEAPTDVIAPGEQIGIVSVKPKTGLAVGTYKTTLCFQDSGGLLTAPVSVELELHVVREISRLSLINVPSPRGGNSASDYDFSKIVCESGYSLSPESGWAYFDIGDEELHSFTGVFRKGSTYFMDLVFNADDDHIFAFDPKTGECAIDTIYINGNEYTPIYKDYHISLDHKWLELFVPITVESNTGEGVEVMPYPASAFTEGSDYVVNGQFVTVYGEVPCKVGYLSGGSYVSCGIQAYSGDWYRFSVPDGIDEVILVVKGDTDLSGEFDFFDVVTSKAMDLYPDSEYSEEALFAADVDDDGEFGFFDVILIKAADLGKTPFTWF